MSEVSCLADLSGSTSPSQELGRPWDGRHPFASSSAKRPTAIATTTTMMTMNTPISFPRRQASRMTHGATPPVPGPCT
jgi:hypothetical protein